MDVRTELFDIFVQETSEHLEVISEALLILEEDPRNKDEINRLFRSFHTIKSSTAFMGYNKVSALVHKFEDLVQAVRDEKQELTSDICSFMLKCQDALVRFMEATAKRVATDETVFQSLTDELGTLQSGQNNQIQGRTEKDGMASKKAPIGGNGMTERPDAAVFRILLDKSEYMAIRAWMVFAEMERAGEILWSEPPKPSNEEMMSGNFIMSSEEIRIQLIPRYETEEIIRMVDSISEIDRIDVEQEPVRQKDTCLQPMPAESTDNEIRKYLTFLSEQTAVSKKAIDAFAEDTDSKGNIWDLYRALNTIKGLLGFINRLDLFDLVGSMQKLVKRAMKLDGQEKLMELGLIAQALEVLEMVFCYSETPESLKADVALLGAQISERLEGDGVGLEAVRERVPDVAVVKEMNTMSPQGLPEGSRSGGNAAKPAEIKSEIMQKPASPALVTRALPEKADPERQTVESKAQSYIRIPEVKVDNLVDLLGELLILQSLHRQEISEMAGMAADSDSKIVNNLMRMERITKEIQTISMSLRMVSLKQTLQKLQRVGRDTAVELGKNIRTIYEGEETEIDRSVVEKIQDPLLHMVRNSISHGIEDEGTRIASGKPARGTVKISAYNKKGSVYIEVTDDGRGLNADIIYNKAIEKGLIDPDRNYSLDEVYHFIYLPGFSTAENLNSISGRGVGMNVVETEVEKIGGRVEIRNEEGRGCSFILKIPINLATINGTVVEINDQKFIIPTIHVKQILKPTEEQFVYVKNRKRMITVRGTSIQLVPLGQLLDFPAKEADRILDEGIVVLVENDQKYKALPVDRVLGKQEVVLKSLGKEFRHYSYLSGATILGDGRVSLILDVDALFRLTEDHFEL